MKNCDEAGYTWQLETQTHLGKKYVPLKPALDEKDEINFARRLRRS